MKIEQYRKADSLFFGRKKREKHITIADKHHIDRIRIASPTKTINFLFLFSTENNFYRVNAKCLRVNAECWFVRDCFPSSITNTTDDEEY